MSQCSGVLLLVLPPRDIINNILVSSISAEALFFGLNVSVCFIFIVGSRAYCTKLHNASSFFLKAFLLLLIEKFLF